MQLLALLMMLGLAGNAAVADSLGGPIGHGLITDQRLTVAGVPRDYHLYLPREPARAPLIILFHGHNSSSDETLGLSGTPSPDRIWLQIAEREKLILAVPNGRFVSRREKGWNDCRADAPSNSRADDVAFSARLIEHLVETYQADASRVYVHGISNGGHFAIRLALEIPEKITAFAAVAAAHAAVSECRDASTPVSALFMNGTADPLLPYAGGQMKGNRGQVWSTERSVAYWLARNGIGEQPQRVEIPERNASDGSRIEKLIYRHGAHDTAVVLYQIVGGGHRAPSLRHRSGGMLLGRILGKQNGDIEMAEEIWSFFRDKRK